LREHYDVVLIDCPPRLTTGCVNALAASDYVLIPVLLEKTSTEAVPRTLSWLKRFQAQVCTELNVLGVVGNKANPRIKLINREQILWTGLEPKCRDAWGDGVRLFDEIIRDHSDASGRFAALDPKQIFYSNSPVFGVSPFTMGRDSSSSWNPGATSQAMFLLIH